MDPVPTHRDRRPGTSHATRPRGGLRPVTAIERFTTIDEAIDSANQSDMGLRAALFTRDLDTALDLADRLNGGGVIINDSTDVRVDAGGRRVIG